MNEWFVVDNDGDVAGLECPSYNQWAWQSEIPAGRLLYPMSKDTAERCVERDPAYRKIVRASELPPPHGTARSLDPAPAPVAPAVLPGLVEVPYYYSVGGVQQQFVTNAIPCPSPAPTPAEVQGASTSLPAPALAQGVKHDAGKEQWGLLPLLAVQDIVRVLTFGAKKYAPDNWRKVPQAQERYYDALLRHLVAWRLGEQNDPESGLPHLAHAGCCLLFLAELDAEGHIEKSSKNG